MFKRLHKNMQPLFLHPVWIIPYSRYAIILLILILPLGLVHDIFEYIIKVDIVTSITSILGITISIAIFVLMILTYKTSKEKVIHER